MISYQSTQKAFMLRLVRALAEEGIETTDGTRCASRFEFEYDRSQGAEWNGLEEVFLQRSVQSAGVRADSELRVPVQ